MALSIRELSKDDEIIQDLMSATEKGTASQAIVKAVKQYPNLKGEIGQLQAELRKEKEKWDELIRSLGKYFQAKKLVQKYEEIILVEPDIIPEVFGELKNPYSY